MKKLFSKVISWILGVSMFMFGVLKFIDPFKTWYWTQVTTSDLLFPAFSYWAGQLGEITVGIAFLLVVIPGVLKKDIQRKFLLTWGNIVVIVMMITAFFVHLNPDVPASVLPLKLRPPYIPGLFLLLALINLVVGHDVRTNTHRV